MTTASVRTLRPLESARPAGTALRLRVAVQGGDVLTRAGLRAIMDGLADVQVEHVEVDRPTDLAQAEVVFVLEAVTARAVDAVRRLAARPGCRPVLVAGEVSTEAVALVVQAGAVGVLRRREATVESVGALLHAVASGEAVVPVDLLAALLPRTPAAPATRAPRATPAPGTTSGPRTASTGRAPGQVLALTGVDERERQVLRLLGDGADTREIARRLSYSERTVKVVVQDLTRRFGLRNRTHAVAFAVRHGLI
ncbi:transcriptional regulator, LuxR family [Cellulomonas flavigena DSM 20109]|uniref:Transcriptional regulator, LuxR family n=1 Tax=Cellulomonas flavigena (strain ATCC 482 / DSM 20109 / BCRC 11376 / JCM 18109 / NBRC 3775 / NCIMB 8073 / NRS 134) TaxID=446466 RepID=D5UKA9_CELFN|nr:response regulator transcription factor [Cellulomonas flavigena]ADG75770.1 transcriptional regulator, LuxR family [Cellulomonas flavigena DSM 20109]